MSRNKSPPDSTSLLGEIVVTATKRTENIQDVPVSVSDDVQARELYY
jgi:hypothetical protein